MLSLKTLVLVLVNHPAALLHLHSMLKLEALALISSLVPF